MSRNKKILIGVVIALAAYLAYRFFKNGGSIGGAAGVNTSGTGSNAGSLAPFVGGSSGPNSGLNYYPGNTQVDINLPADGGDKEPKPVRHKPPKPPVKPPGKLHGTPIFAPPGGPIFKRPPGPPRPRPNPRPRRPPNRRAGS